MDTVRIGVVGTDHPHVYAQTAVLVEAGAHLVGYWGDEGPLLEGFGALFPDARRATNAQELLGDDSIDLVVCAAVPDERAALAVEAMSRTKDVLVDKPGATSLDGLEELRRVQAATGRRWVVFFSERLTSPATVRAGELVRAGAIGRPLHVAGFGPHQLQLTPRPAWFYDPVRSGGILADLASHQIDQFLSVTGAADAEVAAAQVANWDHPEHPRFEDMGEVLLRSSAATGWARVDWFTPDGLDTWGDVRLMVVGTEGTLELRKNVDPAGREGGEHLLLVDGRGVHHEDCRGRELPFARQLLADVAARTETAMTQQHAFAVTELALRAQATATRLGHLSDLSGT